MGSSPTRLHLDVERKHFRRCSTQKQGWETKEEALDVAERMMEEGKVRPGCHITPYECAKCGEWHVSNRIIVQMTRSGYVRRTG